MRINNFLLPVNNNPEEFRRKKLILILSISSGIFIFLCLFIYSGLTLFTDIKKGMKQNPAVLFICSGILLITLPLLLLINRKYSSKLSGTLFLFLLTIVITIFNVSENFMNGHGMFWFAIPIVFSSFILFAFSSFISAGLCSSILLLYALYLRQMPNFMALAAFFIIALVSGLSVKSMEVTVKKFEDITKKLTKELAGEQKSRDRIIKENKVKSAFIRNMSHEIRTPMSAILGISKFLNEHNSENLSSDQKDGLAMIHQSCKKLLILVNEILELTKINAGKVDVFFAFFPVNDLITELKDSINNLVDTKDLIIYFQVDSTLPDNIFTDRKKLYLILFNIVSNLIKYTDTGEINIHVYKLDDNLYFEIKNSSIIITNMQINFILYDRIDDESIARDAGIGFNLSLSKQIIDIINGKMEIENFKKGGAIIRFHIPCVLGN